MVTPREALEFHVGHDESAVVVGGLIVHEPIAWHEIPMVVRRIEIAVDEWIEFGPTPNTPWAHEAQKLYRLRERENVRRALDLGAICDT